MKNKYLKLESVIAEAATVSGFNSRELELGSEATTFQLCHPTCQHLIQKRSSL